MIFTWKVRNCLLIFRHIPMDLFCLIFSVELSLLVFLLFCWSMHLSSRHVSFNIQWKFICLTFRWAIQFVFVYFIRIHSVIIIYYSFVYLLNLLLAYLLSCLANYYLVTGFLFIFLILWAVQPFDYFIILFLFAKLFSCFFNYFVFVGFVKLC